MPTNISSLPKEDVRAASFRLAKTIATKIIVGVVVTVAVTLIANAVVEKISPDED